MASSPSTTALEVTPRLLVIAASPDHRLLIRKHVEIAWPDAAIVEHRLGLDPPFEEQFAAAGFDAAIIVGATPAGEAEEFAAELLARAEFARILKPAGWCVLIWNERRTASTAFLREYEELLLTYGTDYKEVRHERTTAIIHEFFAPAAYEERVFDLRQQFDYEGTAGRLLSSSYAPLEGHPNYVPMMRELERIYRAHARENMVEFEYNTRVYYGKLDEAQNL